MKALLIKALRTENSLIRITFKETLILRAYLRMFLKSTFTKKKNIFLINSYVKQNLESIFKKLKNQL